PDAVRVDPEPALSAVSRRHRDRGIRACAVPLIIAVIAGRLHDNEVGADDNIVEARTDGGVLAKRLVCERLTVPASPSSD
ncbi:MAG: hypothetical protein AAGA32_16590, partial [Pseudomonadota bacterium]